MNGTQALALMASWNLNSQDQQRVQNAHVATIPTGTSDHNAYINAQIANAGAGQAVVLVFDPGVHEITETIKIVRDGVYIAGHGAATQLVAPSGSAMKGKPMIQVGDEHGKRFHHTELTAERVLSNGTMSETVIEVDHSSRSSTDPNRIHVGDHLAIEQENPPGSPSYDYFKDILPAEVAPGSADANQLDDKPVRKTIAQVTAVDGDRITLQSTSDGNGPLHSELGLRDLDDKGSHLSASDLTTFSVRRMREGEDVNGPNAIRELFDEVRIGGFEMKSELASSAPGALTSGRLTQSSGTSEVNKSAMILANKTSGLKLKDIALVDQHSHGIVLDNTIAADVSGISIDRAHHVGKKGAGYGIWIRDVFDSDIQVDHVSEVRHAIVFGGQNVATDNRVTVDWTDRDINFHGGRDERNHVEVLHYQSDDPGRSTVNYPFYVKRDKGDFGTKTELGANVVAFREMHGTENDDRVDTRLPNGSRPADESGTFVLGHAGASNLYGRGGDDHLDGGAGDDHLVGGAGADRIEGGAGFDALSYEGSTAVVIDFARGSFQGGHAGGDIVSGVEEVVGSAQGDQISNAGRDVVFRGAGGDDTLILGDGRASRTDAQNATAFGGDGDDHLFGADGGQTLHGGDGNDHLYGGNDDDAGGRTADRDELYGGAGDDFLFSGYAHDNGGGHLMASTQSNHWSGGDLLDGGSGNDQLFGGKGLDTLLGGDGQDILHGKKGADTLEGAKDDDILRGNDGNDLLRGGGGTDQLVGNSGHDILDGGLGGDSLKGGKGQDTFVFSKRGHSDVGQRDTIEDFVSGKDTIDLSGLAPGGLTFQGHGSYSGGAGEVRLQQSNGDTIVYVDLDGGGGSEMAIVVDGVVGLDASDFVLS